MPGVRVGRDFFLIQAKGDRCFTSLPCPDFIENSLCRFCVISAVFG
jgi:hypothetical protein